MLKGTVAKVWGAAFMGTAGGKERENWMHLKTRPPLVAQNLKLAPTWWCRREQTQASRLTTCLEIRDSHWEIRETRRPGERLFIWPCCFTPRAPPPPPAKTVSLLTPRGGRLMHDESAVCSIRFLHAGLSSNPPPPSHLSTGLKIRLVADKCFNLLREAAIRPKASWPTHVHQHQIRLIEKKVFLWES